MKFSKLNSTLVTVEQINTDGTSILNFNCWLGFIINKKKYEISFEFDTNNELAIICDSDEANLECTIWQEKDIDIENIKVKRIYTKDYKHINMTIEFMGEVLNLNLNCVGFIVSAATRVVEKDNTTYIEFIKQLQGEPTTKIVAFI